MHHIIYLHGFLSSPLSVKAQITKNYLKKHYPSVNFHCLQLSGNIYQTRRQVDALVSTIPQDELRFIGSSMGGFLSTYALEKYGGKAVLINPAVKPHELLVEYLGMHVNPYSGERFFIHTEHLNALQDIAQCIIKQPDKYMVLLQTGDATLDYRQAREKYALSHLHIEEGGDHSFVDYEMWLPKIIDFLW